MASITDAARSPSLVDTMPSHTEEIDVVPVGANRKVDTPAEEQRLMILRKQVNWTRLIHCRSVPHRCARAAL